MTLRHRLLVYRHALLRWASKDFRESSSLQSTIDAQAAVISSLKAKLAISEEALAAARGQIQTLTLGSQRAAQEAVEMREQRDLAREQAAQAWASAVESLRSIADWQARGCRREDIFGPQRGETSSGEGIEGPVGALRGRGVVQAENAAEARVGWAELQEIQARQRARREQAMRPIHVNEEGLEESVEDSE